MRRCVLAATRGEVVNSREGCSGACRLAPRALRAATRAVAWRILPLLAFRTRAGDRIALLHISYSLLT